MEEHTNVSCVTLAFMKENALSLPSFTSPSRTRSRVSGL